MDLARLDEVLPLLDSTAPPRVLGRADALRDGHTVDAIKHRLATGQWRRVLPRTYLTAGTLLWSDRLAAALVFAGSGALLSGAAALADERLTAVPRASSVVVLVPKATHVRSTGWVRIRRTDRLPERALLPGPARVPLARAVADLAIERHRLDDVRALVAEAVRRGLCSVDDLAAELDAGPRRGSAHLRRAVAEVGGGAWSAPEARAATLLRRANVPPFEQNARIDLPNGRFVIVDFLWRAVRGVLEIDSVAHHFAPPDLDATMQRALALETLGYSVVHRSPAVVRNQPAEFVRGISAWLAARAEHLGT